jgi:hypothetical protein
MKNDFYLTGKVNVRFGRMINPASMHVYTIISTTSHPGRVGVKHKKMSMIFLMLVTMMLGVSSCSSMKSDAKKLAKMHYQLEQIGNKAGSTSNIYAQEAQKVFKFEMKTWEKYSKNADAKKEFQAIVDAELRRLSKD